MINVAIAEERRFNREVMAAVLAEVNDDLEHAVRLLTVELADLKVTLAEVPSRLIAHRRWSCPSCRCDLARCSDAVPVAEEDRVMTPARLVDVIPPLSRRRSLDS